MFNFSKVLRVEVFCFQQNNLIKEKGFCLDCKDLSFSLRFFFKKLKDENVMEVYVLLKRFPLNIKQTTYLVISTKRLI